MLEVFPIRENHIAHPRTDAGGALRTLVVQGVLVREERNGSAQAPHRMVLGSAQALDSTEKHVAMGITHFRTSGWPR